MNYIPRHEPLVYEELETPRRPKVETKRRHVWVRVLAFFYCKPCDTTAIKLPDGTLKGVDSAGYCESTIDVLNCQGERGRKAKQRMRSRRDG